MKPPSDTIEMRSALRTEAENMLSSLSPKEMTAQPAEMLLHELLVHKVELEMQNEELRRAHRAMEEARDRYVDLYEFAPLGYITIDRNGLINEINLTGAALLGVDRIKLLNHRFSRHVAACDSDRWHRLFMNIMNSTETDQRTFDLEIIRADASSFTARIGCLSYESTGAAPSLRLSLLDISEFRRSDARTQIAALAFDSPACILVTDAHLNVLRANQAFTTLTGYTESDVIGKKPQQLKAALLNAEFDALMWEGLNLAGSWEDELRGKRKNGTEELIRVTITAVKDAAGIITNHVITLSPVAANA